jgi:hypothetical protein
LRPGALALFRAHARDAGQQGGEQQRDTGGTQTDGILEKHGRIVGPPSLFLSFGAAIRTD